MFFIHMSEQFVCKLLVSGIQFLEKMAFIGIASFMLLLFLNHFPKHFKGGKKVRSFIWISVLIGGLYFVSKAIPICNCCNSTPSRHEEPPLNHLSNIQDPRVPLMKPSYNKVTGE